MADLRKKVKDVAMKNLVEEEMDKMRQRMEEQEGKRIKKEMDFYWNADVMSEPCPYCNEVTLASNTNEDMEYAGETYRIVKCNQCNNKYLIRFDPKPVEGYMGNIDHYNADVTSVPLQYIDSSWKPSMPSKPKPNVSKNIIDM